MYVILDLQPGREDFATQAKQYEESLKLPFCCSLPLSQMASATRSSSIPGQIGSVN